MNDFVLSCCSTVDMPAEYLNKREIRYIPFHYSLDGVEHLDDLGISMPLDVFYKEMEAGKMTKTSQVNAEEFEIYFDEILAEGKDVLHISLSSGISGAVNSANIARDILSEKYPERRIYVVDSLTASAGTALIMDKLADLRDAGKSIDEIYEFIEANKLKSNAWFFSTDLTYFVRGGRVSKTSGFIGNMLNICPLLNVNAEGKLIPREKVRTKKKVIKRIVEVMGELAEKGYDYSDKCFISHAACYDDARAVADLVEESFPKLKEKGNISDIGTTIGSHTGPGTVAVFFWGTEKKE